MADPTKTGDGTRPLDEGDTTDGVSTQVSSPTSIRRLSGEIPSEIAESGEFATGEATEATLASTGAGSAGGFSLSAASLGSAGFGSSEHGTSRSMLGSSPITHTSPVDALKLEEVGRTKQFFYIVYAFAIVVPGVLPVLGGNTTIKWVLVGFCTVLLALTGRLHYQLRNVDSFTTGGITVVAFASALAAYAGVFYWGVFSVAPAIIVMGLYFFSRSESLLAATGIYLTCALLQAGLTGMILLGWFPDPGLFPSRADQPLHELITAQLILQFIYFATFWVARSTRKTTLGVIDKLQGAMIQVAQREALFQEVRQELDQALRIEGGGRYSEQVLGGYKLGRILGRGAMGEVYEAFHVETDDPVAIKVLHPNILENPNHVARFFREAKAASALASEHVVKVIDVSDTMEIIPFMVMERLTGDDLAHHLRQKRRLGLRQVIKLVREVGSVIDAARAMKIVHRDVKPQNLLLAKTEGGKASWKLLDFGVSKLGEHSGTLTQGHVVGTPVYMAPEQARGGEVDGRADIYALGVVVYRCLTGRPPFSGKDVPSILYNVVYDMPPRPSEVVTMHTDLDHVLAIAIAKRPEDRFQTAADLAAALQLAERGELDDHLHAQALAVLNRNPWGQLS